MKKKDGGQLMTKVSCMLLALVLAAGVTACGSGKEEKPAAQEQTAEAAEQQAADQAAEEAAKEEAEKEAAAKAKAEKEAAAKAEAEKEAAAKAEAEKEAAAKAEAEKEAAAKAEAEKEAAAKAEAEKEKTETIKKPDMTGEEPKEADSKKKKKGSDGEKANGLDLLDGKITFDGMELEFPIELDSMKLGNWKIEYIDVDDPESKVLAPGEVVTAAMTSDSFSAEDVKVTAEFGNYSNEKTALTDLPMTGIYIAKEKRKDDKEPKLPEVIMPGGLTWGSTEAEIRDYFGEASFAGAFADLDFDFMYENNDYLLEFGGMNDTGLEYMVYCVNKA